MSGEMDTVEAGIQSFNISKPGLRDLSPDMQKLGISLRVPSSLPP